MKFYFKVRYRWKPQDHGLPAPPEGYAIGSTVTTGVTIGATAQEFQRKHPHVTVESVKRGERVPPVKEVK